MSIGLSRCWPVAFAAALVKSWCLLATCVCELAPRLGHAMHCLRRVSVGSGVAGQCVSVLLSVLTAMVQLLLLLLLVR